MNLLQPLKNRRVILRHLVRIPNEVHYVPSTPLPILGYTRSRVGRSRKLAWLVTLTIFIMRAHYRAPVINSYGACVSAHTGYTCSQTYPMFSTVFHTRELLIIYCRKIMVIYLYPFLVVITQFFSCIIFIDDCICILNGSPG